MQVSYEIRNSKTSGNGIFTLAYIPKGTIIWKYNSNTNNINKNTIKNTNKNNKNNKITNNTITNNTITNNTITNNTIINTNNESIINVIEYTEKQCIKYLNLLSFTEAQTFLDLTYGRDNKLCKILDDGQYMNHSSNPNCKTYMKNGNVYALCDITIGNELFEDYSTYEHPDFLYKLLDKYLCRPKYYDISNILDTHKYTITQLNKHIMSNMPNMPNMPNMSNMAKYKTVVFAA